MLFSCYNLNQFSKKHSENNLLLKPFTEKLLRVLKNALIHPRLQDQVFPAYSSNRGAYTPAVAFFQVRYEPVKLRTIKPC